LVDANPSPSQATQFDPTSKTAPSRPLDTLNLGLNRRKIGLRSLTEAIDSTTPGGRLTFHIFGAMAEFERSIIRGQTQQACS
jgi:hypothetical protein